MGGQRFGYARVSTSTQDAQLQLDALVWDGMQKRDVFAELTSGSSTPMASLRRSSPPNSVCRCGPRARLTEKYRAEPTSRGRSDPTAPTAGSARSDEQWQADHTLLDILVLGRKGTVVQPWLTVVLDDYSRAKLLHLTKITPALSDEAAGEVDAAIQMAHSAGVLVSFDLNYRASMWSEEKLERPTAPSGPRQTLSLPGMRKRPSPWGQAKTLWTWPAGSPS